MGENNFKVGDRVTLHDPGYILNETQQAGVITEIKEGAGAGGRTVYNVRVDNYEFTDLAYFEDELKLEVTQ